MFKMKKLASIAAVAAMTATAMTGLVSTASADEEVINKVFMSTESIEFTGGGRLNGSANITFQGDEFNSDKYDYLGVDPKDSTKVYGTPTLTTTLASGTYSLYYLSNNSKDDTHGIENIEFYKNSEKFNAISYESVGVSEIKNGIDGNNNLYAHRFLFTLDEDFEGTIKFVNTSKWLPDLYAVKITNDPANVINLGSAETNESDGTMTLTLGDDSLIAGTGSIKNENGIRSESLATVNGEAQLRYPAINIQGKKITKIAVKAGIDPSVSVDLNVNVGGTAIASKKAVTGSGWHDYNDIVFENDDFVGDLANLSGYVTLDIARDGQYCGNYRTITFYYEDIENPEPSCTYSIDVLTETVDGESATGVGATVNLNGSSTKSLKWTITKDYKEMHAEYNAAEFTGQNTEFVIGLVVPMEVTSVEDANSKIKFSAE